MPGLILRDSLREVQLPPISVDKNRLTFFETLGSTAQVIGDGACNGDAGLQRGRS